MDANPEAHEHARLRYRRANLRFERGLVRSSTSRCDAIVFLQTIEHVHEPGRAASSASPGSRRSPTSPPPTGSPWRRPGAEKSDNPWHLREYTLGRVPRRSSSRNSRGSRCSGLFHARKLRIHELALRLGWDRVHTALRLTKPFYDRFVPAISASDFELQRPSATSTARSTSSPSAMP